MRTRCSSPKASGEIPASRSIFPPRMNNCRAQASQLQDRLDATIEEHLEAKRHLSPCDAGRGGGKLHRRHGRHDLGPPAGVIGRRCGAIRRQREGAGKFADLDVPVGACESYAIRRCRFDWPSSKRDFDAAVD